MKKLVLFTAVFLLVGAGLFAQTAGRVPVTMPGTVSDFYKKGTKITVTAPNILSVTGRAQDLSMAILRDLPYAGQKNLIVKVISLSGKFPWDKGKMFGIRINNKDIVPEGRVVSDKMIVGPHVADEELKFKLSDAGEISGPITINLFLYAGATYELGFWYE